MNRGGSQSSKCLSGRMLRGRLCLLLLLGLLPLIVHVKAQFFNVTCTCCDGSDGTCTFNQTENAENPNTGTTTDCTNAESLTTDYTMNVARAIVDVNITVNCPPSTTTVITTTTTEEDDNSTTTTDIEDSNTTTTVVTTLTTTTSLLTDSSGNIVTGSDGQPIVITNPAPTTVSDSNSTDTTDSNSTDPEDSNITTTTILTTTTEILTDASGNPVTDADGNPVIVTEPYIIGTDANGDDIWSNETDSTTPCYDEDADGECDMEDNRCETEYITGNKLKLIKLLMWIATAWVVLWCILTILVNICFGNTGHHRGIHFWEEVGIMVLWAGMGVLNLLFRTNDGWCKYIMIGIHYFIVFVAACFFFEAWFATSMVQNQARKNGQIPAILNYILPIIIAAAPCLVTYFCFFKDKYYANGLHCFAWVSIEMLYAFVIPVWILLILATLKSALGNLACDKTTEKQDQRQTFWGKKSCKMLSFLAYWIFMAYLTCMFGSSNQIFWVLCVFVGQSIVLGPLIFVVHTYCHKKTAHAFFKSCCCCGVFYTPCAEVEPIYIPPPPPPVVPPLTEEPKPEKPRKRHHKKQAQPPPYQPYPPVNQPYPEEPEEPNTDDLDEHVRAQDLWGWATTEGKYEKKNEVLFRPRIMS